MGCPRLWSAKVFYRCSYLSESWAVLAFALEAGQKAWWAHMSGHPTLDVCELYMKLLFLQGNKVHWTSFRWFSAPMLISWSTRPSWDNVAERSRAATEQKAILSNSITKEVDWELKRQCNVALGTAVCDCKHIRTKFQLLLQKAYPMPIAGKNCGWGSFA